MGGVKEVVAEAERHATRDEGEGHVKGGDHRGDGSPDERAGAAPQRQRSIGGVGAGDRPQCGARGLGLDTAPSAARAASSVGFHHHMAEVPGIT